MALQILHPGPTDPQSYGSSGHESGPDGFPLGMLVWTRPRLPGLPWILPWLCLSTLSQRCYFPAVYQSPITATLLPHLCPTPATLFYVSQQTVTPAVLYYLCPSTPPHRKHLPGALRCGRQSRKKQDLVSTSDFIPISPRGNTWRGCSHRAMDLPRESIRLWWTTPLPPHPTQYTPSIFPSQHLLYGQ